MEVQSEEIVKTSHELLIESLNHVQEIDNPAEMSLNDLSRIHNITLRSDAFLQYSAERILSEVLSVETLSDFENKISNNLEFLSMFGNQSTLDRTMRSIAYLYKEINERNNTLAEEVGLSEVYQPKEIEDDYI